MTTRTRELIVTIIALLFVSIGIIAYCEIKRRESSLDALLLAPFAENPNDKIVSWLSEQTGFFVHPSLIQKSSASGSDFIVKEGAEEIKESEILMVIPSSAILFAAGRDDNEEEERDPICDLFHALWNEIQLGEESKYAPYINQLVPTDNLHKMRYSSLMAMPSTWSFPGRRLLTMINNGSPQDGMVKVLEEYQHCLTDEDEDYDHQDGALHSDERETKSLLANESEDDDSDDDDSEDEDEIMLTEPPPFIKFSKHNKAVQLSEGQKLQMHILEMTIQHQIDQYFLIPLFDQISHHHYDYNVVHQRNHDSGAFHVVATRSLKPGDRLTRPSQTCLKDCFPGISPAAAEKGQHGTNANLLGALKLFGQVQRYPHYWEFRTGLAFLYHGVDNNDDDTTKTDLTLSSTTKQEKQLPSIEWIRVPTEDWQLDYMEKEISMQEELYETEIVRSNDTVPASEWIQAKRYSHSVRNALSLAVSEGRKLLEMKRKVSGEEEEEEHHHGNEISLSEQAYLESLSLPFADGTDDGSDSEDGSSNDDCDPLKDCTVDQIRELRGCLSTTSRDMPSVVRNATEWHLMRTSYVNAVGPEKATIRATPGSGFRRPYKVAHSPGRGRGVFVTEDIPKGALLWTTEYTAWFEHGDQFRRFLAPLADDIVCDLLLWCYTCAFPSDESDDSSIDNPLEFERHLIGCDLDAGSLINSYDNIAEYNAGSVDIPELQLVHSKLTSTIYATRDIAAGEELVTAYDEFDTDNYAAFGL